MASLTVFLSVSTGVANGSVGRQEYGHVLRVIEKLIPSDWEVLSVIEDRLPKGHYWGMKYSGTKGIEIEIIGPNDIVFRWRDKAGEWHQDPLAKESLKIWIMPIDYRESWRRFFVMKRPHSAHFIVSTETLSLYASTSFRILDLPGFNRLIALATETGWPNSPERTRTLSWATWQTDIQRAFGKG
jgi:hypothetical protein